ncbi:hypothetical protein BUALT_Bualt16G0115500 [Buddleja alternifolia]|uniref:LOB domain-containing protein n=1 Tax=Buddleja alternifolia TaxID=168488 RepID=A0AAV6WG98_9LAMI|nr:hypothetical protein BUALT_Bualt16G0115500 [Buddleja alternifolia]
MTVRGGTTPACAACKYQRRRCTATCPLSPYFPANQPKMFQNVHRLFGVSSITKTLKSLKNKDQRDDAMKSIIYEAEMRKRFRVYGCSVIICQLRLQLQYAIEELKYVHSQLVVHKEQLHFMNESNGFYDEGENVGKTFMGLDSLTNNLTSIQAQMDAFGFNDREILYQNYETKEACHSSSESSLKDTTQLMEHVSQSELRNAAADFTLTTIN